MAKKPKKQDEQPEDRGEDKTVEANPMPERESSWVLGRQAQLEQLDKTRDG